MALSNLCSRSYDTMQCYKQCTKAHITMLLIIRMIAQGILRHYLNTAMVF